jgi:hypothetical protein
VDALTRRGDAVILGAVLAGCGVKLTVGWLIAPDEMMRAPAEAGGSTSGAALTRTADRGKVERGLPRRPTAPRS